MKFKEFRYWCNQRACDGCWGMHTAIVCTSIIDEVGKKPFWKREKFWRENYEQDVLESIVKPIEKKIRELEEEHNEK